MHLCFWAYLTAVSDTLHLQAESASSQEEDLDVSKNKNTKTPFESNSHGSTGRAGAALLSPACPAMPGCVHHPLWTWWERGSGSLFPERSLLLAAFLGAESEEEHSGQWDNVFPPFPKYMPEIMFWPGCFFVWMQHLSISKMRIKSSWLALHLPCKSWSRGKLLPLWDIEMPGSH